MTDIKLRPSVVADINNFFEYQLDEEASYLAAFTAKDPTDRIAYLEKYTKLLYNPTVNMQTIVVDNTVVGTVTKFEINDEAEVAFWIDKPFWGQSVATKALKMFLDIETKRPIFGHAAFDNFGSQKVLEKCGFVKIGIEKGFANARQAEIEELVYKLDN
ncbi:GNAT family N-acetyltransferase [Chryseobacterium sp. ISL-6]|uniref:GNAT family N-acetyltransferase n=1 Tax=Chryseobacterium sp. ISL-6 TaxID=2819143 RepID=UPI001BE96D64|nr:GNAT family N-acetyltransferase [Chryseobacterium sp. ISL-6]MBT2623701.1 GNAT family N-acetyltransferase [Chryseobacterium sp. ISL-6]